MISGYLRKTLNTHINPDIQFFGNIRDDYPDYYEDYGNNFFTTDSVKAIIKELRDFLTNDSNQLSCEDSELYGRIIEKLEFVVSSAEGYKYILFRGP